MDNNLVYSLCAFAGSIPYLAIVVILLHYFVRRARWRYAKRQGRSAPGFCPSSTALGMVFLLTQMFYRPSIQHAVEARLVLDVENDDLGNPETAERQLDRQLKRIRRGEQLDSLVLRF